MCSDYPKILVGEIRKGIWKNPIKPKGRSQKEVFFHYMDKATGVTCSGILGYSKCPSFTFSFSCQLDTA